MTTSFDPYYKWLGIPPEEQPPDCYRLLGVQRFEPNLEVIENVADQRMTFLRTLQTGKHAAECQMLLNEVTAARNCLLTPERRAAYDQQLLACSHSPPTESRPASGNGANFAAYGDYPAGGYAPTTPAHYAYPVYPFTPDAQAYHPAGTPFAQPANPGFPDASSHAGYVPEFFPAAPPIAATYHGHVDSSTSYTGSPAPQATFQPAGESTNEYLHRPGRRKTRQSWHSSAGIAGSCCVFIICLIVWRSTPQPVVLQPAPAAKSRENSVATTAKRSATSRTGPPSKAAEKQAKSRLPSATPMDTADVSVPEIVELGPSPVASSPMAAPTIAPPTEEPPMIAPPTEVPIRPGSPSSNASLARMAWQCRRSPLIEFARLEGEWLFRQPDTTILRLRERERTDEFVGLVSSQTGQELRLYEDRCESRFGELGWSTLFLGGWIDLVSINPATFRLSANGATPSPVVAAPTPTSPPNAERLPPPNEALRVQKRDELQASFKEFKTARKAAERIELADKLASAADDANNDPLSVLVLRDEARKIYQAQGKMDAALSMVDAIAAQFSIDEWKYREEVALKCLDATVAESQRQHSAETALRLARSAAAADRIETSDALLEAVQQTMVKHAMFGELRQQLKEARLDCAALRK